MKKILSCVIVALLVIALCAPAMAEGKITWLVSSNSEQLAGYTALLDRFTEETGIESEVIAGDYSELYPKLQAMIAAKQIPEFASWGTEFVTWAGRGAMTSLDEYIEANNFDLSNFEQSGLDAMTWNDQLWQLPYSMGTCVLYYNAELFDAAGVEYPTTDWNDDTWTMEAFLEVAQKLTLDAEGRNALDPEFDAENIVQFGLGGAQSWWFYPWYYGGDWTNKEVTEYTGDQAEAIQGVQAIYDLMHKYHVMPTSAQSEALASGGDLFMTGKVAMDINGTWACSSVKTATFKWNIAATPIGTQHSLVQFTDGFGIGGGCADPDSMWKFIEWLYTNDDNLMEFYSANSGYLCIPTVKSVKEAVFTKIAENYPGINIEVLQNVANVEEATPVWMRYNLNWNEINTTISNEVIDPIKLGEMTAEEAMADPAFVEEINEIINAEQ